MPVKTHEECRKWSCFFCPKKAHNLLSQNQKAFIKANIFPAFDAHQEFLPGGICSTCKRKVEKNETFPHRDYYKIINELQKIAKSDLKGGVCLCTLCCIVKGKAPNVPPAQVPSVAPVAPNSGHFTFICKDCYALVSTSFEEHQKECNKRSQTQKVENLFQSVSPNTKARFTSKALKEMKADDAGKVLLPTAGRQMPVFLGAKPKEKKQIPITTFTDIQKERPSLSNRVIVDIAKTYRKDHGKRSIEPGLEKALIDMPKELSAYFSVVEQEFQYRGGFVKRVGVVCHDIPGFIAHIKQIRGLDDNFIVRIGMDSGGGYFKITVNIIKRHATSSTSQASKRQKNGPKDSGEKKLFILAIFPNISETYLNMSRLLTFLDFRSLSSNIRYAMDLKMINVMLGLQAHGCTFPCCFCTWRNGTKGEAYFVKTGYRPNPTPKTRTFAGQRLLATAYQNARGVEKDPKRHYSTVEFPLVIGGQFEAIMHRISPPELHLYTGIVNHIIDKLNIDWGKDIFQNWLLARGLEKGEFQYNGPQCTKFLKKLLPDLKDWIPLNLTKYIVVLEAFIVVKESCFSHELHPDFRKIIKNFEKIYLSAGMDMFPKLHILCCHVADFCEREGIGMALFSEQASESVHHTFKDVDKRYPDKLLESVLKFNSLHE